MYNYWLDLNNNKLSTREEGATEDNKYRGESQRSKVKRVSNPEVKVDSLRSNL